MPTLKLLPFVGLFIVAMMSPLSAQVNPNPRINWADSSAARIIQESRAKKGFGLATQSLRGIPTLLRTPSGQLLSVPRREEVGDSLTHIALAAHTQSVSEDLHTANDAVRAIGDAGDRFRDVTHYGEAYAGAQARLIQIERQSTNPSVRGGALDALLRTNPFMGALQELERVATSGDLHLDWRAMASLAEFADPQTAYPKKFPPAERAAAIATLKRIFDNAMAVGGLQKAFPHETARLTLDHAALLQGWIKR